MTTIAFTRPERRLASSIAMAEEMGFTVMAAPSLEIRPCEDSELERLCEIISKSDIAIFTSPTSVEECARSQSLMKNLKDIKKIAIGPNTEFSLNSQGLKADSIPKEYSSAGIVEHLKNLVKGRTVVLIRSDKGSNLLDQGLKEAGADVIDFSIYSIEPSNPELLNGIMNAGSSGEIDVFAFTSPLSASSFVTAAERMMGNNAKRMFRDAKIAAIGNPTASALRARGVRVDMVPKNATFKEMLTLIKTKE